MPCLIKFKLLSRTHKKCGEVGVGNVAATPVRVLTLITGEEGGRGVGGSWVAKDITILIMIMVMVFRSS